MRGQAKVWWGKLTDDDLEKVGGKFDKLIGLLIGGLDLVMAILVIAAGIIILLGR
jgi:hypothetical protein